MRPLLLALAAAVVAVAADDWDYIVLRNNHIEFFLENFTKSFDSNLRFNDLSAIAYDPAFQDVYVSDYDGSNNTFIYTMNLRHGNGTREEKVRFPSIINDMAYDLVTRTLFWTSKNGIYTWNVTTANKPQVIYTQEEGTIKGIAIDSCRGMLYWADSKKKTSTISRISIGENSTIEVIIKDSYSIQDIAIDEVHKKIYWLDTSESTYFSINSADLDGSNQKILYSSYDHKPSKVFHSESSLMWIELNYRSIFEFNLETAQKPNVLLESENWITPRGIIKNFDLLNHVKNSSECQKINEIMKKAKADAENRTAKNETYCLNNGVLRISVAEMVQGLKRCDCPIEYEGNRCEHHKCYNFCWGDVRCSVNTQGQPTCKCPMGRTGKRCDELESCENYCKNGATCDFKYSKVKCNCTFGFFGDSCENQIPTTQAVTVSSIETTEVDFPAASNHSVTNVTESSNFIGFYSSGNCSNESDILTISILGSVIILLIVIIMILSYRIIKYSKKPRIIRRIIGKKASNPRCNRPIRNGSEITIEDCCNMNICETPCFEPNDLFSSLERGDKATLLNSKPFFRS